MTKAKLATFVLIAVLSAVGVATLLLGAKGVYADWAFVRLARKQSETRRPVTPPVPIQTTPTVPER